jgi:hypothetical protein
METEIPKVGEARDPQGLVVTMSQTAWEHITRAEGHPEMRGRLEDVLQAIRTPSLIQASASDPDRPPLEGMPICVLLWS